MAYPNQDLAYLGLLIESNWSSIQDFYGENDPPADDIVLTQFDPLLVDSNGKPLEIIGYEKIRNSAGNDTLKCLAVRDSEGNIYVHFSGTGDGNWDYNKAAYDKEPSLIQTDSAAFLTEILRKYGASANNVYLSGHSQGGNTAQYAALAVDPALGKYITTVMSLDGPGFSEAVVAMLKKKFGEDYFNEQVNKIYAYNGNNDYVHVLGQTELVPANHKYMIKTNTVGHKAGNLGLFIIAHMANYMLNPDGTTMEEKFPECMPYDQAVEAGWRGDLQKWAIGLNEYIMKSLPDDMQVAVAKLVMAFVENATNNGDTQVVEGDFGAVFLAFVSCIPGGDAVMDAIEAYLAEKGITSQEELWEYFSNDPLNSVWDFVLHLLSDPNTILALMKMAATIALAVKLVPVILAILGVVIKVVVPILLALFVVSLIVEFLVQVWDTIVATGKLVAEYVTQLAKDIYEYVSNKIELLIDKTVQTMEFMYAKAQEFAKKVYVTAVAYVQYTKKCIKQALDMACSFANRVARAVTGAVQNVVSIQVELLQSCVDDMRSVATRVQNMDYRLDRLYDRLLNSMIEQEGNILVSLANLYHIARADLNVDEGNRLRRMANNINSWNDAYKDVERWLMSLM